MEAHHLPGVFCDQRAALCLWVSALRQHVRKNFCDKGFLAAEDHRLLSSHGIAQIGAKIQSTIGGNHRNVGPGRHQCRMLSADVSQADMPAAIVPLGL